jgi:hypothetical protein
MKKRFVVLSLAVLLGVSSIQSRVHIRRIGPDNRTEEQKQKEQQEGMTYGIIIAIVIGGLVIWGKIRNS